MMEMLKAEGFRRRSARWSYGGLKKVMKNRIGTGRRFNLRSNRVTINSPTQAASPPAEAVLSSMAPLGGATEDSVKAEKKTERTVKTVKSVFAIFQLEPAPVQSVPIKIGGKYFTAFALIIRLGMGGRGSENPNLNRNPGPSHRVAVCRSDVGKG
jgi:hypothetical protein